MLCTAVLHCHFSSLLLDEDFETWSFLMASIFPWCDKESCRLSVLSAKLEFTL